MGERPASAGDQTLGGEQEGESDDALPPVDPNHYAIESQIGEGGLGRLMRARDRRLGRIVALKLMRQASTKLEARFRREAEITARLQHPGIVSIHEAGRWMSGEPYYAMQLISGASLKQVLADAKTLEERLPRVRALLGVCEAIAYAHEQGVLHRDLKPANIMIGTFGEAIVIDWGLAKLVDAPDLPADDGENASSATATATGAVIGTPAYMPPEQARGVVLDRRADVYALGAVLYEVLSGKPPYEGASSAEVMHAVIAGPPRSLDASSGAPRELIAIAEQAMARDPARRYANASALADDLRRFLDGRLVAAHRYSRRQRVLRFWRRNRAIVSVVTASVIALLAFGAYSFVHIVRERRKVELAQARAERESARLLLAQAKLWLDKDPTVAVAWLKAYARSGYANADEIAGTAAEARARGAARQRVLNRKRVLLAPDGRTLAGMQDDALVAWNIDDPIPHVVGRITGPVASIAFSQDTRLLFTAEGSYVRARSLDGSAPRDLLSGTEHITQILSAGAFLVAGGERGDLWVVDIASGKAQTFAGGGDAIDYLRVSRDGRTVLTHAKNNELKMIHPGEGAPILVEASTGPSETQYAALSPDGTRIAWGDNSGVIYVRSLVDRKIKTLRGHEGQIQLLAFSPDGQQLASTAADHSVRVWDLGTGAARVFTGHTSWTQRVSFSPDGRLLASTGADRIIHVWDLATGDSQVLRGHTGSIVLMQFSASSRELVVGEVRGEVRVWPVSPSSEQVLPGSENASMFLSYFPDGTLLVGGDRGEQSFYDDAGHLVRHLVLPVGSSAVGTAETLSQNGRVLVIGTGEGKLLRVDPTTGAFKIFSGHTGQIYDVRCTADGRTAVTGGLDRSIRLWDLEAGTSHVLGTHPLSVWHVAFSPDERSIASAGDDLDLRVWPIAGGPPRVLTGHTGLVFTLEFAHDGNELASAGTDGSMRLWDLVHGGVRVFAGHTGVVQGVELSPDGSLIATAADDQTARLWRRDGSARVLEHDAGVGALHLFDQGRLLATGANDGTVRVWDTATGALRAVLRGAPAAILQLAVREDGKRLAAGAEDGSVRVWSAFGKDAATDVASALASLGTVDLVDGEAISR